MKNYLKTIQKSIQMLVIFPVLTGNLSISEINLSLSKIVPSMPEKVEKSAPVEKIATYSVDTKNQLPLIIAEKKIQIVPGTSNYEQEQIEAKKMAKSGKRQVIAREKPQITADPGLARKRALVKEAAAANGIGDHWRILEAVWQVETGKSWDRNVSSYAGAQGPWQFMRGTWNKYKPSTNASIYSAHDGAYAAAKLLSQAGLSSGNVDRALLAYNHSSSYVAKVKRIANSIAE